MVSVTLMPAEPGITWSRTWFFEKISKAECRVQRYYYKQDQRLHPTSHRNLHPLNKERAHVWRQGQQACWLDLIAPILPFQNASVIKHIAQRSCTNEPPSDMSCSHLIQVSVPPTFSPTFASPTRSTLGYKWLVGSVSWLSPGELRYILRPARLLISSSVIIDIRMKSGCSETLATSRIPPRQHREKPQVQRLLQSVEGKGLEGSQWMNREWGSGLVSTQMGSGLNSRFLERVLQTKRGDVTDRSTDILQRKGEGANPPVDDNKPQSHTEPWISSNPWLVGNSHGWYGGRA